MVRAPDRITVLTPAGEATAFLSPAADGLHDCQVEAQLNGRSELTFALPATADKLSELVPERLIRTADAEFVILAPGAEERSRDAGEAVIRFTAPENWILLNKVYVTAGNDSEPAPDWSEVSILASDLGRAGYPAGSAGSALYRLLAGSGWTIGEVDDHADFMTPHDLETDRLSLLENIRKVVELWGGYLVWDSLAKTVSLRHPDVWQPYNGASVRFAHNLLGITREMSCDLTTRLYVFGQDDLSIASVNGGRLYIDDHSYTNAVYEGIYTNQEINDPEQLLADGRRVLAELAKPRATYTVRTVDLAVVPGYSDIPSFSLGDMVQLVDPELGIDARARVIRRKVNVFQPWDVTVDVGDPQELLPDMLAGAIRASQFVERALRPNPGTGNLLRGFINTFRTTINSANGRLVWSDSTFEAIEVDDQGADTGRRVRITPGGVGISSDGGQTFSTAITGQGILANAVIVSDLYALASDDGYTQLKGDGLHVFDAQQRERVHVGRWMVGQLEHYGIRIFSSDGQVMLDDDGILQTWQEGRPENVDVGYPMVLNIYLPPETREIKRALLRFRRMAFRAYETGAASGGGTTVSISQDTTGASSSTTTGPSSTQTSGPSSTSTTTAEAHTHVDEWNTGQPEGDSATHTHHIGMHNTYLSGVHSHGMDHTHPMSHTHSLAHTHDMSHSHSIGSHSHAIVYGIYTGPSPSNITVKINGTNRTAALGGPFNADQVNLDIAQYLTTGTWNTIEIGSSGLGRIDATVFLQVLMGV